METETKFWPPTITAADQSLTNTLHQLKRNPMSHSEQMLQYGRENRSVSGGKGDNTAQSTEQSQSQFVNTLQAAFSQNNAQQSSQLSFLSNRLQNSIANPQGYSPAVLASQRAQANDSVAAEDQNVTRSVQNTQAVQGGSAALPSGVNSQIDAGIASEAAQAGNSAQQTITQNNAALQQQNYNNAVTGEMQVAGLENPEGMAGAGNAAATSTAALSTANTAASGPTTGSILGNVAGAAL